MRIRNHRPSTSPNIPGITKWAVTSLCGKVSYGWILAAFLMDTRDQQIAQFAKSGLGRITVNAGKSRSYGAEAALRANLTDALSMNASYGYTYATFTDYKTIDRGQNEISYDGNYVPFVPKHTLNMGGQYIFRIAPRHWLDHVQVNVNYNGAGRIYWTEQNDVSQSFYGTLNSRVSLAKGNGQIDFWVRNALDKKYATFYFESMGNGFMPERTSGTLRGRHKMPILI